MSFSDKDDIDHILAEVDYTRQMRGVCSLNLGRKETVVSARGARHCTVSYP